MDHTVLHVTKAFIHDPEEMEGKLFKQSRFTGQVGVQLLPGARALASNF